MSTINSLEAASLMGDEVTINASRSLIEYKYTFRIKKEAKEMLEDVAFNFFWIRGEMSRNL